MASADLRKMLECCICLSMYKDPVMLKCGHNFCQECIDQVLDAQDISGVLGYSCPECREEYLERPTLSRNIALRNIMEHFLSIKPFREETGIFCTYCVEAPVTAVKSCLHCEAYLCEKHLRVHSKSPEHIIADPNMSIESRKCSVHKKILEYYCTEEAACICVYCSAEEHRSHKVVSLDEASENKKKELREDLSKLASKRDENEGKAQSLQEYRRKELEEKTSVEREKVVALFIGLRKQLEELEMKVLGEITRQVERAELSISDLMKRLDVEKEELEKKMRHIEELCDTTDPLTVLQESDCGDVCDTKEGDNERLIPNVGDLDLTEMSRTLHCGLSDIITGVDNGVIIPVASDLSLDVNTAHNLVYISDDRKMAVAIDSPPNRPKTPERFKEYAQVLSRERFTLGRHYWEVSVAESYRWRVGVCYPSIARKGRPASWIGYNDKSWCLEKWNHQYSVIHDSQVVQIPAAITSNKVRIYLDYEAGRLSLYDLCHPMRHLHTFNTAFTEPLHAALALWEGGCIELSGAVREM